MDKVPCWTTQGLSTEIHPNEVRIVKKCDEKVEHSDTIALEAKYISSVIYFKAFTAQRLKVCRTLGPTASF